MRKIIETTDYSVSALFAVPKDYGSAMEYIHYIEGTKQYKDLIKLMQKYHIEGPNENAMDFKIVFKGNDLMVNFHHRLGTIDIRGKDWSLEPNRKVTFIDNDMAEGIAEVKAFYDEFMKLNITSLKSVKDF